MRFVVPGEPVGKQRPRVVRGPGGSRAFTPERTVRQERAIGWFARQAGVHEFPGAVAVRVAAHLEIPPSASRKRREAMLSEPCTKKPDIDNLGKLVLDALNGIAYRDDSQVVSLTVSKHWSDNPRTEIEIESAHGDEGGRSEALRNSPAHASG